MTPEPCTTHGRRKKHLSTNLKARQDGTMAGRSGTTLCGEDGEDQQRVDAWRERRPTVVAGLPACRLCERAAAKLPVREEER